MCDYCGCRDIPAIAELSDEHDRLLDLAYGLARFADSASHDQVVTLLDGEFGGLLRRHTDKEERGVFRALRSIEVADDRLDRLVGEHRDLERQLSLVRSGTPGWRAVLAHLVRDLAGHVIDEEVDLFPFAMYELDDAQWSEVVAVHDACATGTARTPG